MPSAAPSVALAIRPHPMLPDAAGIAMLAADCHGSREQAWLFAFDDRGRLCDAFGGPAGSAHHAVIDARMLRRVAAHPAARYVALFHRHPGGSAAPSSADRDATRRIAAIADALDLALYEHCIAGNDGLFSFHAAGLL